ncbi:J domain-containing protein [Terrabacter sp. BE26]|uniref:J domain-containing protein n=1 Tax=Terrabacter sp. BE26 TaxID=2898152 RepID=UPI0035BE3324
MAHSGDLYAVLGVPPSATQEQVRRAYRALLRLHHPDARAESASSGQGQGQLQGQGLGGDERDEVLQRAIAAYAVLGDPELRAAYDRARRGRPGQPVEVHRSDPRRWVGDEGERDIRVGPVRWHGSGRAGPR